MLQKQNRLSLNLQHGTPPLLSDILGMLTWIDIDLLRTIQVGKVSSKALAWSIARMYKNIAINWMKWSVCWWYAAFTGPFIYEHRSKNLTRDQRALRDKVLYCIVRDMMCEFEEESRNQSSNVNSVEKQGPEKIEQKSRPVFVLKVRPF